MSNATAIVAEPVRAIAAAADFTREQLDVLKASVAKDLTDAEFAHFAEVCRRSRLDPFRKQIYAMKRNTKQGPVVSHQTGIDGFRVIAQRSGEYEGQLGPLWCGKDGSWRDVWLSSDPPVAARVGVLRRGFREPLWATARYEAYVQTEYSGGPNSMWRKMPDNQLAKCAEALALRKAFPEDLSGLYTVEEMGQADNEGVIERRPPGPIPASVERRAIPAQQPANAQQAQKPAVVATEPAHAEAIRLFIGEFERAGASGTLETLGALTAQISRSQLTREEKAQLMEPYKLAKAAIVHRATAAQGVAEAFGDLGDQDGGGEAAQ